MSTRAATREADELVCEISIAAPPERVFQAIVDPAQVVKWWGQAGIYWCTEFQSDLRVGGKWRCAGEGGQFGKFEAHGEYLQIDRPRLLVHSWIASWTRDAKTAVHWELEPKGAGNPGPNPPHRSGGLSGTRQELQRLAAPSGLAASATRARGNRGRSQAGHSVSPLLRDVAIACFFPGKRREAQGWQARPEVRQALPSARAAPRRAQ